jgi:hypothetical protein
VRKILTVIVPLCAGGSASAGATIGVLLMCKLYRLSSGYSAQAAGQCSAQIGVARVSFAVPVVAKE